MGCDLMICNTTALPKSLCLMLVLMLIFMSAIYACGSAGSALSINGTKFEDQNDDGFLSLGENGISGWTIRLFHNSTWTLATTDEHGSYTFSDLGPGIYTVIEDHQSGWRQTSPGCHAYQITLLDKSANNIDFGDARDKMANESSLKYQPEEYTFMHPSPGELLKWAELARRMPKAPLTPEIEVTRGPAQGSRFSLLDKIQYCPAERDQGKCGNCWIWAATGALEVDMASRKGIKDRLSIQYFNSQRWCCGGGNPSYFADFLNATGKVIPWSNANGHWCDGGIWRSNKSSVQLSFISTTPSYAIDYIVPQSIPTLEVGREVAIRNIKNVLHQGKAIYFSFTLPTHEDIKSFNTFWANQSEGDVLNIDNACGKSFLDNEGSGHAVLCVGYDDTDPHNRYWIMLNSWGTQPKRQSGLFRVNMDMNYDCFYPYGEYGILGFGWYTFDIHYAEPVRAIEPEIAKSSQRPLYRPLGTIGMSSDDNVLDSPGDCSSCNSSQSSVWAPIAAKESLLSQPVIFG